MIKLYSRKTYNKIGIFLISLFGIVCSIFMFLLSKGVYEKLIASFIFFTMIKILIDIQGRINKSYNSLLEYYPELKNGVVHLNDVDYLDEDLKIIIYGNHLISYSNLASIDLSLCEHLIVKKNTGTRAGIIGLSNFITGIYHDGNKRLIEFPPYINNYTSIVGDLCDYILEYYEVTVDYSF